MTDGFAGYNGKKAALGDHLKHTPVIQRKGHNGCEFFPIVHTLFSTIKAWIVGTHHGVSDQYLIRRAVECAAITYDQIVKGKPRLALPEFDVFHVMLPKVISWIERSADMVRFSKRVLIGFQQKTEFHILRIRIHCSSLKNPGCFDVYRLHRSRFPKLLDLLSTLPR